MTSFAVINVEILFATMTSYVDKISVESLLRAHGGISRRNGGKTP